MMMTLSKYGYYIVKLVPTTLILGGHIEPAVVHMHAKQNQLQHLIDMLLPYMCQKHMSS